MSMKLTQDKKGQTMVEFALILPLLLFILFGLIEFGRLFFIYSNLFNAAREGSRYGITSPRDYNGIALKTRESIVAVPTGNVYVWVWYDQGPGDSKQITNPEQVAVGDRVVVYLEHVVEPLTPLFEPILHNLKLQTTAARTIQSLGTVVSSGPGVPPPPSGGGPVTVATNTPTPTTTATPGATSTSTPTPALPTPTPTFGPTLTPSPTLPPDSIVISEPIMPGATTVVGAAQPGALLTLRVVQTGLKRTVTVDSNGQFVFDGLTALVGGYTVVVQGYGMQDTAVVATPTATPTPTSTPNADPYLVLEPACTNVDKPTILVRGYNWPTNSSVKQLAVFWDGVKQGTFKSATSFSYQFTVDVTSGQHTIMARTEDNKGNVIPAPNGASVTMQFVRPCEKFTAPINPTVSPNDLPDLVMPSLTLNSVTTDTLGTYEMLRLNATVANTGTVDVTSLFWVDLFMDPASDVPLAEQPSVDYVAINGLSAGSAISFTMYVPGDKLTAVGSHTLVALADTWDQTVELSEDNNTTTPLNITINVQNPMPTPTPTPQTPVGNPGSLEGRTYIYIEDQLQSLGSVSVYIYDGDQRLVGSAISDENGFYQVVDLPAGTYLAVGQVRMGDAIYHDQLTVTILEDKATVGADLVLEGIGQ